MNRLGTSSSAYLRSAAHQPIHWFPWSDDAFAAAQASDKPMLLDIGAVWCHWCHVMDGESYEDPAVAAILNEHFVCLKVDRDERPDIDARYQRAVQALTGQGGWPLTAFLTPNGDVFYGGTYFPPEGKYQRPGFPSVLAAVLDAYRERRDQVTTQADAIRRVVAGALDETAPGEATPTMLDAAVDAIARHFDPAHGGFGSQPKFPHPAALSFLMQRWATAPSRQGRLIIEQTLDGMAAGGIHDQLGGGFHRYSVDAEWIVPHFEKMSYDNSELLKAYLDAAALFGAERFREIARGIVRWVREVMADPDGGYAASQDADVGLEDDGDYFTWTRAEAAAVLEDDEFEVAATHFDIGAAGEMHHNPSKNVLHVAASPALIARRTGREVATTTRLLETAKIKLKATRDRRPTPFVDRTRYAHWNAMMASAMLRAGASLGDDWATAHALRTLERLYMENDGDAGTRIAHAPGMAVGFLDDQVQVAAAALDAYEHTGGERWLARAERLMEHAWRVHHDADGGGLIDAPIDAGDGLLPTPAKSIQDAPTPSANGAAGLVAGRLAELTGDDRWRERQRDIVTAFAARASELGLHAATYFCAADWYLSPTTHLVVVGPGANDPAAPGDAQTATRMHRRACTSFVPRRVVHRLVSGPTRAGVGDEAPPPRRPLPPAMTAMLATGRDDKDVAANVAGPPAGRARGYACTADRCFTPADTESAWQAVLTQLLPKDPG